MKGSLLSVLGGTPSSPPPIWMMRQAGRYLPEYRETRAKAGSFLGLCATPELAAEVTLQPLRRFDFDAAIIFSDILTVPMALGIDVKFGDGPKLEPLASTAMLRNEPDTWARTLKPVYEALRAVRAKLGPDKALIGFAGAPWTLATYMAGGGNDEQKAARLWAYRDPDGFGVLVDLLVECVSQHLIWQIEAGADVVQIFDSWAAGLPLSQFERWVARPTSRIVDKVRRTRPDAKIIGFPRGAGESALKLYAESTGVDAISLDTSVNLVWAVQRLGKTLQGNLDPLALMAGGVALHQAVEAILEATRSTPFIFNLGHGVLPGTPVDHVTAMVEQVRGAR